jgi:pseudouridine-5'-phosphate glycosidase
MAKAPLSAWLTLSAAVRAARKRRQAVVALESAVLTHGLPPPDRLPVAGQLEEAVQQAQAVPAFIALLEGKARVGLTPRQVRTLAGAAGVSKCARADLGWLLAQKKTAGTTVSATIYLAARVGIQMAATGGIGGVHRDASETFDISADLLELARTPVTLVCSGAKTIVDLRKTLEFLESRSVPVIGFTTEELPGFFARGSGLRLRATARTIGELAATVRSYRGTGYGGSIVVANPVPAEAALPVSEVESLVAQGLQQATEQRVSGAALTPFLLETMNRLSGGATLRANKALLQSNAALAARLAVALRSGKKPGAGSSRG